MHVAANASLAGRRESDPVLIEYPLGERKSEGHDSEHWREAGEIVGVSGVER